MTEEQERECEQLIAEKTEGLGDSPQINIDSLKSVLRYMFIRGAESGK